MDGLELALQELKYQNDHIHDAITELDKKARQLLSSATIITTLFGALKLSVDTTEQWITIPIFATFSVLVVVILYALLPSSYSHSLVVNEWDILASQPDGLEQLVKNYTRAILFNRDAARRKARANRLAIVLMAFLVIMLVFSTFGYSYIETIVRPLLWGGEGT